LEGTIQVLANGGQLPMYAAGPESTEISAKKKGVKQGAILFLLGIVVVPAFAVLYNWIDLNVFGFLAALSAVLCFIGGPLRMLFAALFEEGARRPMLSSPYMQQPLHQPQLGTPMRHNALPPQSATPAPSWRQPTTTGELVRPGSVTENTTRLLNKDTDRQD
jgi:hypothetical protein